MRARWAFGLVSTVLVYAACGGRLIESGNDYGGAANTGASSSVGGTPGQGARSNTGATNPGGGRVGGGGASAAGGSRAAGGVAGTTSFAGTAAVGGSCTCAAIDCAPGYTLVPDADGCCVHCEPLCANVGCPGIACGSGSHLELLPGQCCPTCVRDSCAQQLAAYQSFRRQLIEKYSTPGCMTNADCTLYYDKNECGAWCGVPIPSTAIPNLDQNLRSYAASNCSPDCATPSPPCDPRSSAVCVQGRCQ